MNFQIIDHTKKTFEYSNTMPYISTGMTINKSPYFTDPKRLQDEGYKCFQVELLKKMGFITEPSN